jgi:HlyD family secretion protein
LVFSPLRVAHVHAIFTETFDAVFRFTTCEATNWQSIMSENDLSSLRIDRSKKATDQPSSGWWKWLVAAAVVVGLIIGYFLLRDKVTPATAVRVATASLLTGNDASADLVATGYVVAQRKAEVASKATGRLEFLGFEEGDLVKSGQVIARLDDKDFVATLELAKAGRRQAEVDSLDKGRKFRRAQSLFKSGSITDVDLESAEAAYQSAIATVQQAAANVRVADVNLDNTIIRAPFDGTVLTKNADVGEIVAPFASSASSKGSVVTLADMSSLEVEADVAESNLERVKVGRPCEVVLDAYPTVRYQGRVKKIVPTADRSRATVLTRVEFLNRDERVLPEMSARVSFFTDSSQIRNSTSASMLTVPKDAVTTREDNKVVFRIDDDRVTSVPVEIGKEIGTQVEVVRGLNPGDRVVLSPPGKMISGQKISITQ